LSVKSQEYPATLGITIMLPLFPFDWHCPSICMELWLRRNAKRYIGYNTDSTSKSVRRIVIHAAAVDWELIQIRKPRNPSDHPT
jgi:hypothetical protein